MLEHQMLMNNNHNQNIEHYLKNNQEINWNVNSCNLLRRAGVISVETNAPVLIEK